MVATAQASILLVEDSDTLAATYSAYLSKEDLKVQRVATGAQALVILEQQSPQVMLLDLKLPDMDGLKVLEWMVQRSIPTSVIIITAYGSVDSAVDAMRLGVSDFLEKPFDAKRLKMTVNNALKLHRLSAIVDDYQRDVNRDSFHGFVGSSLPMQQVYRMIEAVAPSKATVFITGESGTGKEVCAEAIHKQGPRAAKPFVALNCGAIPKDLMESEIFGHVKGAFTGAHTHRAGAALQANGGTLFLDEIGEMDLELQTKLLRFVQTGRFQKVGGSQEEVVDIRFLCATNRDPWEEVKAGRFREDLYYRLYVVPLHLSPLRDRGRDIITIALRFLQHFAKEENKQFRRFSNLTATVMSNYNWPGNVRELQNVIRNVCVLHDGIEVLAAQLPFPLSQHVPEGSVEKIEPQVAQLSTDELSVSEESASEYTIQPLWLTEKQVIEQAIEHCDGNIPKASELLEVSPSTIYRKKQAWEDANLA
ncbi:sigma-54-dependent Fis family transcriptional regulator [Alginatibacterium sediminis]|uniref:Sigma-54-dependent Fis family transcriptional regulator n=1 Tax=Alginatibacterium sediminis TaxID=2164068 RepID=A0A420EDN6_9ALTE|nr:sigma-54 dependent transcriptional regulator [Alginatibacterium sediminis]RKF18780.1 sigma-54-dependent Fis family transcriptional regulator [Alginatibacterium sediminis]